MNNSKKNKIPACSTHIGKYFLVFSPENFAHVLGKMCSFLCTKNGSIRIAFPSRFDVESEFNRVANEPLSHLSWLYSIDDMSSCELAGRRVLKKSTKAAFTTCSKLVFLLHHAKALHKRRFFWAILREFGNITVLCSIVFEQ